MSVEYTTANKQDGCQVSPGGVVVLSVFLLDLSGLDLEKSAVDMEERREQDRGRNVIIRDRVEKEKSERSLGIYVVALCSCPKKHVLT